MRNSRIAEIDFLRAVSTVGFIIIHTLSFHLSNQLTHFIWNYLHFVEVGFVFCSGYVLAARNHSFSRRKTLDWYGKRIVRLLTPFYVYLLSHYMLWLLFPQYFSGLGLVKSPSFFVQSLLLVGGVDLGWLPLLFIEMALLFPFFILMRKKKYMIAAVIFLSLLASIVFAWTPFFKPYYRFVMWLPWSFVLLISIIAYEKESLDKQKVNTILKRLLFGLLFLSLFLVLFFFWKDRGSINLTSHKYPPDLYYLSFAVGMSALVSTAGYLPLFKKRLINLTLMYISRYSFSLFFIHFIVLDAIITGTKNSLIPNTVVIQLLLVFSISFIILFFVERVKNRFDIHYG